MTIRRLSNGTRRRQHRGTPRPNTPSPTCIPTAAASIRTEEQANAWYRKAAEQGNADAQYAIGYSYANGRAMDVDNEQAVGWYQKSAAHGQPQAQYALGYMYSHGFGVREDDTIALGLVSQVGRPRAQRCAICARLYV